MKNNNKAKKGLYTLWVLLLLGWAIYLIQQQFDNNLVYTGESFLAHKYCMSHDKTLDIEYNATEAYDWSHDPFALSTRLTETWERYVYDLRYLERDLTYISSYCIVEWQKHIEWGGGGYFGIRSLIDFSNDQYEQDIKFVINALINKKTRPMYEKKHIMDNVLFYTPFNRADHLFYWMFYDDRIIGKMTKGSMVGTYLYDYQLYASGTNFLVLEVAPPIIHGDVIMMEENRFRQ